MQVVSRRSGRRSLRSFLPSASQKTVLASEFVRSFLIVKTCPPRRHHLLIESDNTLPLPLYRVAAAALAVAQVCMRSTTCGVQSFRFMPRPNIVSPSPDNYNHRAVFRRAAVDSFFPAVPINLKRSVPSLPFLSLPLFLSASGRGERARWILCGYLCSLFTRGQLRPRPAIIHTRVSGNE